MRRLCKELPGPGDHRPERGRLRLGNDRCRPSWQGHGHGVQLRRGRRLLLRKFLHLKELSVLQDTYVLQQKGVDPAIPEDQHET